MNVSQLNQKFGIAGMLEFRAGKGGLPGAVITSSQADAVVSLYGAHVLSYRPKGKADVLWMSGLSNYEEGKPIRGGIPICFPWFGPHAHDAQKPQHGFARLREWSVASASALPDGGVELRMTLNDTPATQALWPYAFAAELVVNVGAALEVTLRCTNTGAEEFTYTDALHSYLAVSDIGNVKIAGLGGCAYVEGPPGEPFHQKEELLEIRKEVNRRYLDTTAECRVDDAGMPRSIRIGKKGSRVTVVWNPWETTAKAIADMPDEGYKTMICVEAVNTSNDAIVLAPGKSFSLGTVITVD
jgi:glucose-6-phosphate 1-epimerase